MTTGTTAHSTGVYIIQEERRKRNAAEREEGENERATEKGEGEGEPFLSRGGERVKT